MATLAVDLKHAGHGLARPNPVVGVSGDRGYIGGEQNPLFSRGPGQYPRVASADLDLGATRQRAARIRAIQG